MRTSQFHFTELQQARQRKHESPRQFLDRCRILAQRTVPCVTDATLQRAFREQAERMLVAAYTAGLTGAAGREVRLRAPETTGEAVRIATTVEQAELQERRNDSFYMDSGTETTPAGKVQERPGKHANTRSDNTRSKPPRHVRTQNASDQQPIQKARSDVHVKCYECSGYGQYSKDCANRRNRTGASNAVVKSTERCTGKKGHEKGEIAEPTSRRKTEERWRKKQRSPSFLQLQSCRLPPSKNNSAKGSTVIKGNNRLSTQDALD